MFAAFDVHAEPRWFWPSEACVMLKVACEGAQAALY